MNGRSAIVILADGARADVFEDLLAAGELPNVAEHVTGRGGYARATSTFTSTTIPAHLPMLAGRFAGSANLPGYRWFDRTAHRRALPLGPWCLRSYNGPEAALVDRDIDPDATTLFDLTRDPVNVFGAITRGLPSHAHNRERMRKNRLWLRAHYRHEYAAADRAAAAATVASLDRFPESELRFVVMPGIDWTSHYVDPLGDAALAAYRRVDDAVAAVAARLIALGRYEDTQLAICSDHGHCPVEHHFDLPVWLDRRAGMRVAYHSLRAWRPRANAIACVSGNAMAHIYMRGPGDWRLAPSPAQLRDAAPGLVEDLLEQEAVDLVVSRAADPQELVVNSRRGRAVLRETSGGIEYRPLLGDPFGFPRLPRRMSYEQALALTFDTCYPDGLVQAAQIFRSRRCGDVVVSAAPGFDLRDRYERPEHRSSHGALHREHMIVPVASSAPIADGPLRTADLFPTLLQWLGLPVPAGIDGISRLAPSEAGVSPRSAAARA